MKVMFAKMKKNEKGERKVKKRVDMEGWSWYYIRALEKRGLARGSVGAQES